MRYQIFSYYVRLTLLSFLPVCFGLWHLEAVASSELSKDEFEQNRVVIRVWHYHDLNGNGVGHVSVQLPFEKDNYISFWPEWPEKIIPYVTGVITKVPGQFNSLVADYMSENFDVPEKRVPDTIVSLYTLNATKIQERFLDFKKQITEDKEGTQTGWALCGDCWLVSKGSQQHSCSSLALSLLKSGDLRDLFLFSMIPAKDKVSYSLQSPGDKVVKTNPAIVSPNSVATIALSARKLERTRFSLIQGIPLYENDIDLTHMPKFSSQYKEQESPYTHVAPRSPTCSLF